MGDSKLCGEKKNKADFIAEIQFSPLHAKDAGKKRQVEWLHHFEPLPAMFEFGTRIRRRRIGLIWISKGAERWQRLRSEMSGARALINLEIHR